MKAHILCISDLHKRYRDSANIKGQTEAIKRIQQDLINLNIQQGFTHNILLGDWYHKGYHSVGHALSAIEEDRQLSNSVDGNVYLTIGNHTFLERDSNPETYITQPNDYLKPSFDAVLPTEPIFKVVPQLQIGGVQIDFFHYNKLQKDYVAPRNPETTYRIGIYHDDCVVPGWVREQEGYLTGSVTQSYLNYVYEDIDLAILGHIHTSIGVAKVELQNGRSVPLIIPGSLGITSSKDNQKHPFVKLPIIDIEDDDSVHIRVIQQSTHMECLTFIGNHQKKEDQTLEEVSQEELYSPTAMINVSEFMRAKGHGDLTLNLIHQASTTPMSLQELIHFMQMEATNESTGSI